MITNKKTFTLGMVMLISFTALFFYIMTPSFGNGRNGLEYADDTFNALSKGSAYFIQDEMIKAEQFVGQDINVTISSSGAAEAETWTKLYTVAGVSAGSSDASVTIKGDLGQIFSAVLADADAMYHNQGSLLTGKYDLEAREATYAWYNSLKQMGGALDQQGQFRLSAGIQSVLSKAVEPAYNFYGIQPSKVADHKGTVFALLAFYLIYTMWYGFSIYFISDGVGITMSKSAKKAEA